MITLENLKHQLSGPGSTIDILNGINLQVNPGDSLAIVGASGSGKSTLLGIMAGLDTPSAGRVYLDTQEITQLSEEQRAAIRRRLVAFVFQNFQLLESLTALENILLPLEIKNHARARQLAETYLTKVGLAERSGHYPRHLSGGEQQRVAIARAFACQAPILFADEPTGNLDNTTGKKVSELLFELNGEAQTTLILVTHDPGLAERCARQVRLSDGELEVL